MKIGVMLPIATSDGPGRPPTWPEMRGFATHAEAVGLDSVWVCDHLLSKPIDEGIHESWTIVSALAATTSRIEIGQLVMCLSFRNPGLLAKMAVTADQVSGGRLTLGVGAGWHDPEYEAFGFPTDHKAGRFEEQLQIIGPLLRGERVTYAGAYHAAADAALLPPPSRTIPVLIAGHGPRMLRLTAQHADAWNTAWYGEPDERLAGRLADLRAALEKAGRDPATLRITVGTEWTPKDGNPDRRIDAYRELGIDDLIFGIQPADSATLDLLAQAQ